MSKPFVWSEYIADCSNINDGSRVKNYRAFVNADITKPDEIVKAIKGEFCHDYGMMLEWCHIHSMGTTYQLGQDEIKVAKFTKIIFS